MVKLISATPDAEKIVSYCARVSAPKNQENYDTAPKLIKYLIKNQHWSPLEMVNMVVEIETGRDIAPQILRHRSFSFQEFSQRYAEVDSYVEREARQQDLKNRQNSTDDLSAPVKEWFKDAQLQAWTNAERDYRTALSLGIAKECARALLPLNTKTRIYMNGTLRSWVHYIQLRTANGTQQEHKEIAEQCKAVFKQQFPTIAEALEWL